MNANAGTVDHLDVAVMRGSNRIHDAIPYPGLCPTPEAVVAGCMGTITLGQVGPGGATAQHPENAVQNPSVIHPRNTPGLPGQNRLDHRPFEIAQIVTCHPNLPSGNLNHDATDLGNPLISLRPSLTITVGTPKVAVCALS